MPRPDSRHPLPTTVAVVSFAYVFGAAVALVAAGVRALHAEASPPAVLFAFAAVALALALVLVWRGRRVGDTEASAVLALGCLVPVVLTMLTRSDVGALTNANAFFLAGLYAAWFVPPATTRWVLSCAAAVFVGTVMVREVTEDVRYFAAVGAMQALAVGEIVLRLRRRLHAMATTDPLTGVLNRRGLAEAVDALERRPLRRHRPLVVLALDLDGLKEVNDGAGHQAGDELIRSVTRTWSAHLGPGDLMARTGGDEFLVVTARPPAEARALVAGLRALMPGAWTEGIAVASGPADVARAAHDADHALRDAKAGRRA